MSGLQGEPNPVSDKTGVNAPSLLEAALQYAGRGWRVLPVHTTDTPTGACSCERACGKDAGKHPRIKGNAWDASSTDPVQIIRWWKRWPKANIGIATGDPIAVLDLDSGRETQQARELAGGPLPETFTVATGRGIHLYFAGQVPASGKIGSLLLRGRGGFVLAPPSLHASGKRYSVVLDRPLAPLPNFLAQPVQKSIAYASGPVELGEPPEWVKSRITAAKQVVARSTSTPLAEKLENALRPQWSKAEYDRILSALKAVPASIARDPWLKIGMALHSLEWEASDGTNVGLEIWRAWSSTCPEKFSDFDVETRWRSFRKSGVGIGTLFHIASQHGWKEGWAPTAVAGPGPASNGKRAGNEAGVNGAQALPAYLTEVQAAPIIFPDTDRRGRPLGTCPNARAAIRAMGLACAYDRFHDRYSVGGQPIEQWAGLLTDQAVHALRIEMHQRFGFDPGTPNAHDAAVQECLQHAFDPVLDYLEGLAWDGVPRVATWLESYLGASDTPLNRAIGQIVLTAAVRRARRPGAKFDEITVLVGGEGKGKSTAIEVLAGTDNFSDQTILTLDDRGQQEAMAGVWLYEIADLSGLSRAEVERVKAFASRRFDRARPAWGRVREDRPRRCVLFATTNADTFLRSQTGNRRFWPVEVGRIDLEGLKRDRDQLWAEAAAIEARGGSLHLPAELWGAASVEQVARLEHDPWDDLLLGLKGEVHPRPDRSGRTEERVAIAEVLMGRLALSAERASEVAGKRLMHVMRRLGWEGPKVMRIRGEVQRGYFRAV